MVCVCVCVCVCGEQWRGVCVCVCVSILPQISLIQVTRNIGKSSMCYTVGPYWLCISNMAVGTCPSQTHYLFPLATVSLFSKSVESASKFICILSF